MTKYAAHAISLPLFFTTDPRETKMFRGFGQGAYLFEEKPLTLNSHNNGIDPTKFETDAGLKSMFKMTSVSYEPEGDHRVFTATMESNRYPFFGT